ncbi:hypothetical protein HELRODRAFT_177274 [Helobdella robusta]|uniref:Uncharacterized protein n=1 Tax=Helobdella robusta TaxID=6412 RepID=T1FBF8_HELRO|nr:hypothetical protein HELRODRAFT_177274 [Helobdella robusta]ESN98045.1 hypothetical protein HELRODRAFT_177274 [Helobdella robusta]
MSYKQSSLSVTKNKDKWSSNLKKFQNTLKRRNKISIGIKHLYSHSRMPKEWMIIGRYLGLASTEKSRLKRITTLRQEIEQLWSLLNFPILSLHSVGRKIETLLKKYDTHLKKPVGDMREQFDKLFDVTNKTGQWLCAEDKKFYQIQIQSRGKTGYARTKNASQSTIHPSKRKIAGKVNDKLEQKDRFEESSNDSSDNEDSQISLVQSGKLSVRRAAIVSTILNKSGVKITTPSQSGVYRAVYREANKVMKTLMNTLCNSSWCLHFDGKIIKKKEHQVVLLRNEVKEVRLAVLVLPDGKATTIASAIQKTLDDYNLWAAIKMIVSDTTNVNTGSKSGVVVRLQKLFVQHGESAPVFIGCQHHILDRVLRHLILKHSLASAMPDGILEQFLHCWLSYYCLMNERTFRNCVNLSVDNGVMLGLVIIITELNNMNFFYMLLMNILRRCAVFKLIGLKVHLPYTLNAAMCVQKEQ